MRPHDRYDSSVTPTGAEQTTLADLRRNAGLTQLDVAFKVGVTTGRIGDWERGRMMPSTRYLRPLAEALGVTIDEVVAAVEASAAGRAR